ncbi:hypothetical protein QTN47_03900 [Danxiaibacter flavus]|uniref:DUF4382 domain-containing protein n=1 Tax=Danxiaibacter flavus TaxID=3049108 RepID=A0ABV3ZAR6_9BACT|nr:hypothetical protein QNM32_03900 [Chitinophagaceae bacterium DXS]
MKTEASILLLACSFTLFACTKSSEKTEENAPLPIEHTFDQAKYAVTFSLGNVDVDKGGRMGNKEMQASDYLWSFFYAAYDSTGKMVSSLIQNKFDENDMPTSHFGLVLDSLATGSYTIVLAGSNKFIESQAINLETLPGLQFKNFFGTDFFYKKLRVNVVNKDTSYTTVKLNRLTSRLHVKFKDTFPQAVNHVVLTIDNMPSLLSPVDDSLSMPVSGDFNMGLVDNVMQQEADLDCIGSYNGLRITIKAYDVHNVILQQKVVDNIYLYPNKKVILTGNLDNISDGGSNPIVVTLDPDYDETSTVEF